MNNAQKIGSFLLLSTLVLGTASLASANNSRRNNPRQNRPAINQEARAALEANDYEAFLTAHEGHDRMLEQMTEERFGQMQEVHELIEAGDIEAAQELREEFGFTQGRRGQRGQQSACR